MTKHELKVLNNLIADFLAERRKSDGGFAPVTEQDLNQLCSIMEKLTGMKWGRDADGDLPIDWEIIDRTRFERMHFQPVPYQHKAQNELAANEHLNAVVLNARIANDELNTTLKLIQLELRSKTKER